MTKEPSDFWNYPDWYGDSRDNLRSPGSEPFWMRPARVPEKPRPRSDTTRSIPYGKTKLQGNYHLHRSEDGYVYLIGDEEVELSPQELRPPKEKRLGKTY